MGAKRILLSIVSGAEAELSMDELSEITEYIQEQAGEEAEMIFGHGVDPELDDRIRVTVIATGFVSETMGKIKSVEDKRKVHDLDKSQTSLFSIDNPRNQNTELKVTKRKEEDSSEEKEGKSNEERNREFVFTGPFAHHEDSNETEEEDGEPGLFQDEDFDVNAENYSDQVIDEDGMIGRRDTRQRLEKQARERKEHLKDAKKHEMTKDEFNEKWSLPAYLRRGVKMQDVPHSSEPYISKYNLNDDNQILGNNKFLHDNVD